MMKMAVVGIGSMGINHLRVLMDIPDVEVVGVADVNVKLTKDVEKKYKIPIYSDYKELLREGKPEAAVIVVPTIYHHEVALFAISHGIHILVEKPIASSTLEAQEMIEAAESKKVILGVGHIERFNPAIIELKKRIDRGDLGRVFMIHSRRQSPYPSRIQDVGVASDLATHELDMMRYLTGSEVDSLKAEISFVMQTGREDIIFGLLRFKNDVLGILDVNWVTPTTVRELCITGEKGMYVINYWTQELLFFENPAVNKNDNLTNWESERNFTVNAGNMTKFQISKREPLRSELIAFIESVKKGERHLVDGSDGYKALLLAEQIIVIGKNNKNTGNLKC